MGLRGSGTGTEGSNADAVTLDGKPHLRAEFLARSRAYAIAVAAIRIAVAVIMFPG